MTLNWIYKPVYAAKKPNFIVILLDDIGPAWFPPYAKKIIPSDIEPYIVEQYKSKQGHHGTVDLKRHIEAARTSMPTLDKMAQNGVVFHNCMATASLCAPSRIGFLTGSFQQRWGAYGNRDTEDLGEQKEFPFLTKIFQKAGYQMGVVGKWHLSHKDPTLKEELKKRYSDLKKTNPKGKHTDLTYSNGYKSSCLPSQNPLNSGFNYYYGYNAPGSQYYEADGLWEGYKRIPKRPKGEFLTDLFNNKVVSFVENSLLDRKPFFLYYAPMTVHGKMEMSPSKYSSHFNTGNKFTDSYAGHLLAIDDCLKKINELLKNYKQEKNTVIVFTSDNGQTAYSVPPYNAPFKGGKGTGWIGGLRVPLIIWGHPKLISTEVSDVISMADVLPSLLAMADLPIPNNIDGKNWYPYLSSKSRPVPRQKLFSSGYQSTRWSTGYALGNKNSDSNNCPLYAWMLKDNNLLTFLSSTEADLYDSLPKGKTSETWFHDLNLDPSQSKNIYSQNPEKVKAMRHELHQWLKELKQPHFNHKNDYEELINLSK